MSAITIDSAQIARARSTRAVSSAARSAARPTGQRPSGALYQARPTTSVRRAPSPRHRPAAAACRVQAPGPARSARTGVAAVRPGAVLGDRALLAIMVGFGALLLTAFAVVIQGFWMIGWGTI